MRESFAKYKKVFKQGIYFFILVGRVVLCDDFDVGFMPKS